MPLQRPSAIGSAFLCLSIAGALANLLYAIDRLPPLAECLRVAATPLDHSRIHDLSGGFRLLSDAASIVPAGAVVRIDTGSDEALRDGMLHRTAAALLPGRRIVAASSGSSTVEPDAEYVVLIGAGRSVSGADLLHSDGRGSIWKMRPR